MRPCDVLIEGEAYGEVLLLGMVYVGKVLLHYLCGFSTADGKSVTWKVGVGLRK